MCDPFSLQPDYVSSLFFNRRPRLRKTNRGRALSPIKSIQHVAFTKFLTPKCPAYILVSQKSKVLSLIAAFIRNLSGRGEGFSLI